MKSCNTEIRNDYQVTVCQTMDEIEGLRLVWQEMQSQQSRLVINADIDRYISVIESMQKDVKPYVLLLRRCDEPVAMVIGRLEKAPIKCRFGYKTVLKPNMRCLNIVYGGILGRVNEETASILYNELINTTRRGRADVIAINHLRNDSVLYRRLREKPNIWCRGHFPKTEHHWCMSVPKSIDLFYAARSNKHRNHLKKYMKRLEKDFLERVKLSVYTSDDAIEYLLEDAAKISAKTYQYALGCGFLDNNRKYLLLQGAAKKGWLLAYVIKVDEQPVAFQVGMKYAGAYFVEEIGHDPEWKKYNIGTILFLKILDHLCKDDQVDTIDFGFGDAEYKQRYGNNSWDETTLYIFAPRLFPVTINIVHGFLAGMSNFGTYILKKFNSVNSLKRKWRDRLRNRDTGLSENSNF
ncbi:MAG: GNAT family N-acetyltransferase [Sedimentisphaerales bacterium]|nr:GNAT family N-acetyltransferase [Sedimentisphaerales bacterium]